MTVSGTSTWEVLRSIGFSKDPTVISDSPGGLSFDFGPFKLKASVCMNRFFTPVIALSGVLATTREIGLVECEMPREVESWEQGVAWVTWSLDNHVHGEFQPKSPAPWLEQGRQHRHLLPWERERAAYEARPHCMVDRDWARVGLRKLGEVLADATDHMAVSFQFDGEILRISCGNWFIAMPASGAAWGERYSLYARSLRHLPKRLMRNWVQFSIWESALSIGNIRYEGVFVADAGRP